ncbi:MAG: hypothetical protein ACJA13_002439 [Paraglaciecola sp.]
MYRENILQQRNDTKLKLAWLPGMLQSPNHSLTLVIKGCFDLVAGDKAVECDDPDGAAIMGDMFVGDKPEASLRYANDLVIFKPKADLTLSGAAYPRPGEAGCRVTFGVGPWRKSLAIFNQRFWRGGKASAPGPFTADSAAVPLTYENAFGGTNFSANPVGKGLDKVATAQGEALQPLPNIEHLNQFLSSPSQKTLPAGFGPLKDNWGDKTPVKGTYGDKWLKENFPYFPPDFDWHYFNTAPQDQQVPHLAGDESLYFENLRPDSPQFSSQLPALRPRLFVKGQLADRPFFVEVKVRLDSLHVDMEAQQVNLVWRGVVGVQSDEYEEISHACLYTEDMAEAALPTGHYQALTEAALLEPDTSFDVEEEAQAEPEPEEEPEDPEFAAQMAKMFSDVSKQMKDAGAPDSLISMIGPGMDSTAFMAEVVSHYDLDLEEGQKFMDEAKAKQKIEMRAALIDAGEDPGILDELEAQEKQQALEDEQAASGQSRWSGDKLQARIDSGEGFEDEELQGVDFAGWDLSGLNFSGADLTKANLSGAVLSGTDFTGADLTDANLSKAMASGAIFDDAILANVDASEADFSDMSALGAQFQQAKLIRVNFTQAKLQGADFTECVAAKAIFTGSLISEALFEKADLSFSTFEQVTAIGSNFSEANLRECVFCKSELSKALLNSARLTLANFEQCDLSEASLEAVDAQGIVLLECTLNKIRAGEKSNFTQAEFSGGSGTGLVLEGADLSNAMFTGLSLQGADFSNSCMNNTVFSDCDMKKAEFTKASITDSKLSGLNLFEAGFSKAKLVRADLSLSNLFSAEFYQATLQDTNLKGTNIKGTKIAQGMVEIV